MAENENGGVHEQPRLESEAETSAPKSAEPMRQDDPLGGNAYKLGENLTSRYIILSKIGEGAHAVVFECWDREEWECVAIKVSRSTGDGRSVKYEIALLQHCAKSEAKSRYVQIRNAFVFKNRHCIVFEKLGPSLREFLKINSCLPVPLGLVRIFGRQLLEAVACLHEREIIHTDLKPENILLVSPDYVELQARERCSSDEVQLKYLPRSNAIKLIDFGSSFLDEHRTQIIVTTRNYRAPEIILGLDWSLPIDMWSVGCVLAELCTGQRLFNVHQELDLEHLASMERVLGPLPNDMTQRAVWGLLVRETEEDSGTRWTLDWPEEAYSGDSISLVNSHCPLQEFVSRHVQSSDSSVLTDLLKGLLQYEPSQRLTARGALEHPFFKNPQPTLTEAIQARNIS